MLKAVQKSLIFSNCNWCFACCTIINDYSSNGHIANGIIRRQANFIFDIVSAGEFVQFQVKNVQVY